ncbi:response regulator transcription factor [Cohnella silvisoli]|uniref:Response regulator n=1 Tax=Cohnella silvisoli TaxID=2873699 RepID=A0ABV1KU92_9BACL|nr:response regulator [Cohnella silvisoli]MCD9023140.1 response regulator [Cohnella silvisoli]
MMLNVLIVDDEPAALRSLRNLIPWEQYGFRIIEEASNGEEALESFRKRSIDLIISDIRMPRMDGLHLIAGVREFSEVPIILLSGYGEFEYARRAMQLGVKDYLLKPVSTDELKEKLLAVKVDIENEAMEKKKWYQGMPLVREQLVRRWARGLLIDPSAFNDFKWWAQEGGEPFCVFIVELTDLLQAQNTLSRAGIQLRRFAVRNVVEELFGNNGLLFEESLERFGIVYMANKKEIGGENLWEKARLMRSEVAQYAKAEIAVSIGPIVSSFEDVPGSYEAALEVLNKQSLLPAAESIWLADRVQQSTDSHYLLVEEVKQIVKERYAANLELKQIAAELFVNPNQLGQLFRSYAGISFKDYLLQKRLDAAKDLLMFTDKKVYEISQEVGFKEIDWFYKKFKQYTGKSANEFRTEME